MKIHQSADATTSGALAAKTGAGKLRQALENRSYANIIVATGASQFEMLKHLIA